MTPCDFKNSNTVYAVNQPEYLPLPAHRSNAGVVTSCWKLSFWERIVTLCTGKIYLQVMTFKAPLQPQRLIVKNPVEIVEEVS